MSSNSQRRKPHSNRFKQIRFELRQALKSGALHTLLQKRTIESHNYLVNQRTGQIIVDPTSLRGVYAKIKKGIQDGSIPDPRRIEVASSG